MRDAALVRSVLATTAAAGLIHLLLVLPNHPGAMTPEALLRFPLELPVIALALVLAPRPARVAATAFVAVMTLLKLADLAAHVAFLRAFNPFLDLHLAGSAWELSRGALGTTTASAAAVAVVGGIAAGAWWATGRLARLEFHLDRPAALALLVPALVLAGADAALQLRPLYPGTAFTTRLALDHLQDPARAREARADLARFRAAAADDPGAATPAAGTLADLRGRDVIFLFVESYGRSAFENPRFAPTIAATLTGAEARLASRGLAMRSGWLTAPVVGGQSWLAHASLLAGLEISDQQRYRALLESRRRTLVGLAAAAGWRTVAVMPAMTRPWPEAAWFDYDAVLGADGLGYLGRAFDWVTMPDQFTLAAFERAELTPSPRAPVFAVVALLSSHAPWPEAPPLLPWEAIGDGRAFDAVPTGDPPEVVWRSPDRVRARYRAALDYALGAAAAFAERRAAEMPLIVLLGDHQPAAFVFGDPDSRDVPVHLIGAAEAIAAVEAWGWTPGLVPGADLAPWPMAAWRDRFLAAFATPAGPLTAAAAPNP